nr:D-alanine--D-alanine ligase [Actinomycetota bacterium]
MKVAVLGGGRSSEHDVSLASAAAVREGLAEGGHEPLEVLITREGRFLFEGSPLALDPGGGLVGADIAFPVLHGPFGEDGTVQGLLELLDLPYVGAGVAASALAMDKVLFKEVMAQAGVLQVDYLGLRAGEDRSAVAMLGLPVFVKPARLGSSVGIAKVSCAAELGPALDEAFAHDSLVIVEAFSGGLEVECSVLGNGRPEASEPGEIAIHAEWYDYEAKYRPGGMELVVPARISAEDRARVRELAVESFLRIGCAGLARADFFVEPGGRVL